MVGAFCTMPHKGGAKKTAHKGKHDKKRDDSPSASESGSDLDEFSDDQEDEEDYKRGAWRYVTRAVDTVCPSKRRRAFLFLPCDVPALNIIAVAAA